MAKGAAAKLAGGDDGVEQPSQVIESVVDDSSEPALPTIDGDPALDRTFAATAEAVSKAVTAKAEAVTAKAKDAAAKVSGGGEEDAEVVRQRAMGGGQVISVDELATGGGDLPKDVGGPRRGAMFNAALDKLKPKELSLEIGSSPPPICFRSPPQQKGCTSK